MNNDPIWSSIDNLRNIFAIVLGLALSEAFKQFVADRAEGPFDTKDSDKKPIRWDGLLAIASFLLLLIPFYHGMARYLFVVYRNPPRPEPYGLCLLWDVLAFTSEASLFFVMSRAIRWLQWRRFYWAVVWILVVDSAWGGVVWYSHRHAIWPWLILNIVFLAVFLAILGLARRADSFWGPILAVTAMALRTGFDYGTSWDFYFPPSNSSTAAVVVADREPERRGTKTIYFAAPLFTQAEWRWNATLVDALRRDGLEVIVPQERAAPMVGGQKKFDARELFVANVNGIERADVVLAILDGADPDSGTSWEVGYAYKRGRPVLGIRTDLRGGGDDPKAAVNLMLTQSCLEILTVPLGKRDDVSWTSERIAQLIRPLGKRVPDH